MKSGLSSRARWYPAFRAAATSLIEHRTTYAAPPIRRVHPHALDLAGVGGDPAQARRADGRAFLEGEQEATVWRLELGDCGDIVLHGLLDRESEPVSRVQFVVAPR